MREAIRRAAPALTALAVFALAALAAFSELWSHDPSRTLAVRALPDRAPPGARVLQRADATYEAWLVARNARTLATAPHRLFDAPHCAPAENTLAYGIPMITMGALALPAWLLSDHPVLIYNLTLVLLTGIAALAMYALVTTWTGIPAAGIAAGLLFAFHPIRLHDVTHPSVWDASWTVLALLFAERLFARGRWRDAFGLAAAIALQIAASFYPLLAATLLALPFGLWLLLRDAPRAVSAAQIGLVVATTLLTAALVLGPYLGIETQTGTMQREHFTFAALRDYLPGARFSPGFVVLAGVALALATRRDRAGPKLAGDPRGPLLAGALLVALVAAGSKLGAGLLPPELAARLPNLYGGLARFVPGLDAVRGVFRLSQGVHLALVIVAGLGVAACVRRAGRAGAVVGAALVLVAGLEVLRAPALGWERAYRWEYETVEPDPETLAFFAALEASGNTGPLLELPVRARSGGHRRETERILLNAYHGRRTSACFGSYRPPGREALARLGDRLGEPESIRELARLGFTTVVIELPRHPGRRAAAPLARLDRKAAEAPGLVPIHRTARRSAYALRPEALWPLPGPAPRAAAEAIRE